MTPPQLPLPAAHPVRPAPSAGHTHSAITSAQLAVLADLQRWSDVLAQATPLLALGADAEVFAMVLDAHHMMDSLSQPAALHTLQRARQLWPSDVRWPVFGAHQSLALGLLVQAQEQARAALALQPNAPGVHACLAQVLAAGQNWAGAAQVLDAALAIEPAHAGRHAERARMAHNLQQRRVALRHVHEALRLEPAHPHALALLAALQGVGRLGRTRQLLAQALRANPLPGQWQRQWRDLGVLWWLDVALAVLGCALVLTCQPWVWAALGGAAAAVVGDLPNALPTVMSPVSSPVSPEILPLGLPAWLPLWWPRAVAGFNVLLAWSWLGRVQRMALLWPFAYALALCWASDLSTSLPKRWLHSGPAALWDWETLAYLGGAAVMALLFVAAIGLLRMAGTEPLRLAAAFAHEGWRAWRGRWCRAWLLDVARRPAVHFNVGVGALALVIGGPWVSVAMGALAWIVVMPLGVWALAVHRLPAGQRPDMNVVFWVLGMVPGLATFVWAGSVGPDVVQAAPWLQALWVLGWAAFAMLQANSLRQA